MIWSIGWHCEEGTNQDSWFLNSIDSSSRYLEMFATAVLCKRLYNLYNSKALEYSVYHVLSNTMFVKLVFPSNNKREKKNFLSLSNNLCMINVVRIIFCCKSLLIVIQKDIFWYERIDVVLDLFPHPSLFLSFDLLGLLPLCFLL